MKNSGPFFIRKFPASRIGTLDVLEIGRKKHHIKALLELDVTAARAKLQAAKQQQKKISFTAWMIKSISNTLRDFPDLHAYLKNKRTIVCFEDIDVSIMVEKESGGKKVPIVYIIRKTQEKSIEAITQEIQQAKQEKHDPEKASAGHHQMNKWSALYFRLPSWLRRRIWRFFLGRPRMAQSMMGSVLVSSVGIYGKISGWFIPTSVHPLSVGVGSIVSKPKVIDREIIPRDILHLTLLMDHDVTDGGQMARFVKALQQAVEQAQGLL
jgi:pyruvate/2-oxoglutarate dehydrogenase complex dihydrolipoamide acyltransferase (E2) component